MRQISRKYDRASVNPGVGIGVPAVERTHRLTQRFFCCPQHGRTFMGGPCGGIFGCAGPSTRYANATRFRPLRLASEWRSEYPL